jgi:hypothetical protein
MNTDLFENLADNDSDNIVNTIFGQSFVASEAIKGGGRVIPGQHVRDIGGRG